MMSEVSFVCPTCGSSDFFTKSSFDRHIRMHSVQQEFNKGETVWATICSEESRYFKIMKYVKNQDKSDLTIFNTKKIKYYK